MSASLHVTVAALARSGNRYLLVAERIDGKLVINQPAGHWEPDETLYDAVVRETLEETGWAFEPKGLVGIYQYRHANGRDTFLRFVFHGDAVRPVPSSELDSQIERVLWWTEEEIRSSSVPLRGPQVLRCIDDFQRGARYNLACLNRIGLAEDDGS